MVVCEACSEELEKAKLGKVDRTAIKKKFDTQLKTYVCSRCSYKFRVDEKRAGVLYIVSCPYCGKDDKLLKA